MKPPKSHHPVSRWLASKRLGALRLDLALFVISVVAFVGFPQIDRFVVARTFNHDAGRFIGAESVFLDRFVEAFDEVHLVIVALCLIGFLAGLLLRNARGQSIRRGALFLFLLLFLAPGLVVNGVLKEEWGRARPQSLMAYQGDRSFTRAFQITDQCETNCAFTSGHAAIGFYFLGLAWAFYQPRWLLLGLALGTLLGGMRIVQGRHYLSDVVFSFWVVYGTAIGLAALLYRARGNMGNAGNAGESGESGESNASGTLTGAGAIVSQDERRG